MSPDSPDHSKKQHNCLEQEIFKENKTRSNKWRFLNRSQVIHYSLWLSFLFFILFLIKMAYLQLVFSNSSSGLNHRQSKSKRFDHWAIPLPLKLVFTNLYDNDKTPCTVLWTWPKPFFLTKPNHLEQGCPTFGLSVQKFCWQILTGSS